MAKLLALFLIIVFSLPVFAVEFDRTALVPELTRASKAAQASYADYRSEINKAEKAAEIVASDLRYIPVAERSAVRARALCQWERSLNIMADRLENFYSDMVSIKLNIEDGVMGGLGEAAERIDTLTIQLTAELEQQNKTYEAMSKVYKISPDAAGEGGAQKLNTLFDAMARSKEMIERFKKQRERIKDLSETMQMKVENLNSITDAVAARITEIRTEAYVVRTLKSEDQVSVIENGLGNKGGSVNY